jgi:hypothetical protein
VGSLRQLVYDNNDHVPLSFSRWNERSSKVHRYCVPAMRGNRQRLVKAVRLVGGLVGLTMSAGANIFLNVRSGGAVKRGFRCAQNSYHCRYHTIRDTSPALIAIRIRESGMAKQSSTGTRRDERDRAAYPPLANRSIKPNSVSQSVGEHCGLR